MGLEICHHRNTKVRTHPTPRAVVGTPASRLMNFEKFLLFGLVLDCQGGSIREVIARRSCHCFESALIALDLSCSALSSLNPGAMGSIPDQTMGLRRNRGELPQVLLPCIALGRNDAGRRACRQAACTTRSSWRSCRIASHPLSIRRWLVLEAKVVTEPSSTPRAPMRL